MEKSSKWYQSIQIIYKFADKYGDAPINDDDDLAKVYYAAKAEAKGKSGFIQDMLIAFVHEKERELRNGARKDN